MVGVTKQQDGLEFQFRLMQLADYIGKLLWKEGKKYTVCTRGSEVHVLTHEQASKYNDSRFNGAVAKMRKCNRRLIAVDVSKLSPEMRQQHDETIARQSRMIQALKGGKAKLEVKPVVRNVPVVVRPVKV